MGLAAPKKKIKLSHDPNNTRWTSDKSSFGHKILTSQGWVPGDYLGVKHASHAELHTAANASHIRVAIKDDNLGLGAKLGTGVGHGECTGLDAFKNLLGRLNGKDEEEIEKEQKQRDDIRRAIYTEKRWGSVRFVSAGFLIGDKIQVLIDAEAKRVREMGKGSMPVTQTFETISTSKKSPVVENGKKSKKRKAEIKAEPEPEVVAIKLKTSKKKRKSESNSDLVVAEALADIDVAKHKPKKERSKKSRPEEMEVGCKSKKRKRERREDRDRKTPETVVTDHSDSDKALNRRPKPNKHGSDALTKEVTSTIKVASETSGRSTPIMQGRHVVRSRNIAQKRLASMDVASLNQIFMIKT